MTQIVSEGGLTSMPHEVGQGRLLSSLATGATSNTLNNEHQPPPCNTRDGERGGRRGEGESAIHADSSKSLDNILSRPREEREG